MARTFQLFTRQNLFAAIFLVLLAVLLWLLFSLLVPFLPAFLWALILAMVIYPAYEKIRKVCGGRPNLAAFLTTLALVLVMGLPGFFILANLGHEVGKGYETLSATRWEEKGAWAMEKMRNEGLMDLMARWGVDSTEWEKIIRDSMASIGTKFSQFVLDKIKNVLQNILIFLFLVFSTLACLFFFLRDGEQYARKLVELLPLSDDHRGEVVSRFTRTVSSVVRAMFLTSLAQGILAGLGFMWTGVPLPILFGLVTAVNSFIPFLGAASIWLPASIWLLSQDQPGAALGLALWGFLVVSTVDNVIKPLIIGGDTKIPIFLIFFTILGGLKLYGFLGVFLGPIILSMGLGFLSIYRDVYVKGRPGSESKLARRRSRV